MFDVLPNNITSLNTRYVVVDDDDACNILNLCWPLRDNCQAGADLCKRFEDATIDCMVPEVMSAFVKRQTISMKQKSDLSTRYKYKLLPLSLACKITFCQ